MKSKQPQWRIVQLGPEYFSIQQRNWLGFWCKRCGASDVEEARRYLSKMIVAAMTYPRVIEEVNSTVEYVKARLSQ